MSYPPASPKKSRGNIGLIILSVGLGLVVLGQLAKDDTPAPAAPPAVTAAPAETSKAPEPEPSPEPTSTPAPVETPTKETEPEDMTGEEREKYIFKTSMEIAWNTGGIEQQMILCDAMKTFGVEWGVEQLRSGMVGDYFNEKIATKFFKKECGL